MPANKTTSSQSGAKAAAPKKTSSSSATAAQEPKRAKPPAAPAPGIFDPQQAAHQCIGANTKLKNIPAPADAVRVCINCSIPLQGQKAFKDGEITGEGSR